MVTRRNEDPFHSSREDANPSTCGTSCVQAIYVMDADGSNQTKLIGAAGERDRFPNWSPDGSRISFERKHTSGVSEPIDGIYTADADGSNVALIAGPGPYAQAPDFSNDGSTIAYDDSGYFLDTSSFRKHRRHHVFGRLRRARFTYLAAPAVTAISPKVGFVNGGMQVTITGSHLTPATRVLFGRSPAAHFTVVFVHANHCDSAGTLRRNGGRHSHQPWRAQRGQLG